MSSLSLAAFFIVAGCAVLVLAPSVLAIWAVVRYRRLRDEFRHLSERLGRLETRAGTEPERAPEPVVPRQPAAPPPRPAASEPPPLPAAARHATGAGPASAPPPQPAAGLTEVSFASRWLVWLGSVALLMAGAFLVKYSVDNQLLSPGVRIFLGVILGLALVTGGEMLRRRPLHRAISAVRPDHVPPALTAAGVATLFGSVYAGHALYQLFPLAVAFAGLSLVAFGALGLSLLHGRLIAVIGLLGATAVPLLVGSQEPSFWALYLYLSVVAAGTIALIRYQNWWWLGGLVIAGAALWDLAGMAGAGGTADLVPLAIHLVAVPAMFVAARFESLGAGYEALPAPYAIRGLSAFQRLVLAAATTATALAVALVRTDSYGILSLAVLAAVIAGCIALAARWRPLEIAAAPAAALGLLLLATWHLPYLLPPDVREELAGRSIGALTNAVLPPQLETFALVAALLASGFAVCGYLCLWRSRFPAFWASLSAGVPVAVLAVVYWRLERLDVPVAWASLGLLTAAAATWAATRLAKGSRAPRREAALGCYALGVVAAISLGATMTLEHAWLTQFLALQLPVMAWVNGRFAIPLLRPAALAVTAVVVARLVMLNNLPFDVVAETADAGWILYSYGPPVVAFWLAGRWFRRTEDDPLVATLEAAAIATFVTLVGLEIRSFVRGEDLLRARYDLLEASLHSIAWLATGYGLYRRQRGTQRSVFLWAGHILIALGAAQVVVIQGFGLNPLVTDEPVGEMAILNTITLAYGLPGVLALLIGREAGLQGHATYATAAGALALLLILADITFEVRHAFHGTLLTSVRFGEDEGYAYSVAWLIFAGILLALGIGRGIRNLRLAALGVLALAIAKVFLWDMGSLSGLYRVASFLGLGLALMGVGYLYQRFVAKLPAPAGTAS